VKKSGKVITCCFLVSDGALYDMRECGKPARDGIFCPFHRKLVKHGHRTTKF